MRVLHVVDQAAALDWFKLLSDNTDRSRAELSFFTVGPSGPLQAGMAATGHETGALNVSRRAELPLAAARLAVRLKREDYDVVHGHQLEGALVGLGAGRLAGTGVRVMTAHHSHEMPLHRGRALRADQLCVKHLAHRVIAPSEEMATTFRNEYGVGPERVSVIHHGLDLKRFRVSSEDARHRLRAELGVPAGAILLLAISRLYWIKNLEALIRGFIELADDPPIRLMVVGGGDQEPLRALADELGGGDRILFSAFRDDIPDLLSASDALVHPSLAESFGQVIIEAMAAARPVVATPVGIAPEVIVEGLTGFLSDGFDPASIKAALVRALEARSRWPAIGAAAAGVAGGFPAARMAEQYVSLYEEVLSGKRGAR